MALTYFTFFRKLAMSTMHNKLWMQSYTSYSHGAGGEIFKGVTQAMSLRSTLFGCPLMKYRQLFSFFGWDISTQRLIFSVEDDRLTLLSEVK